MKELVKVNDNTFYIGGEIDVWDEETKTIEKDGEIYTNTKRKIIKVSLTDLFLKDKPNETERFEWNKYSTTFMSNFGKQEVDIYAPSWLQNGFFHSDNMYVSLLVEYLNNYGVKYLELTPIKYEKNRVNWGKYERDSSPLQSINITLHGYGFNNSLKIEVSLKDFFDKDLYLCHYSSRTEQTFRDLSPTFNKHIESKNRNTKILDADKIKILTELITNRKNATSKY